MSEQQEMTPAPQGAETDAPDRPRQTPLAQRVYQVLLTRITAGDYPADHKLPGEFELAAQLAVSRPIVREALQRLRDEGLVYSRKGAGSFVARRPDQSPVPGYSPVETIADIQRCYEFRIAIEPEHAFYAALRRNRAALDAIEAALELMHNATRARHHRDDADFAFHFAVAQASNNHYYVSSMMALKDHIAVGMRLHGATLMGAAPNLAHVLDEHTAIFQAIRDRQPDVARDVMRRHLEGSRNRVFEGRALDLSL